MPESTTDRAHRSREEISNFHQYGDARGPEWLESHPDDRDRAHQRLHAGDGPGSPPQQQIPA